MNKRKTKQFSSIGPILASLGPFVAKTHLLHSFHLHAGPASQPTRACVQSSAAPYAWDPLVWIFPFLARS